MDVAAVAFILDMDGPIKVWLIFIHVFYQLFIWWMLCQAHGSMPFVFYFSSSSEGEQPSKEMPMQWQSKHNAHFGNHAIRICYHHTDFPKTRHILSFDHQLLFPICIKFKTLIQSYRQDRVYIGVRRNSLAVWNAQLMTQVTRQCPCIEFHQLSGYVASQRGEDTEYRAH